MPIGHTSKKPKQKEPDVSKVAAEFLRLVLKNGGSTPPVVHHISPRQPFITAEIADADESAADYLLRMQATLAAMHPALAPEQERIEVEQQTPEYILQIGRTRFFGGFVNGFV
jgi:hypothetical protein